MLLYLGKTHTMMGSGEDSGLIPRCIDHLFEAIDAAADGLSFLLRCSYMEIYNEKITDLLVSKILCLV